MFKKISVIAVSAFAISIVSCGDKNGNGETPTIKGKLSGEKTDSLIYLYDVTQTPQVPLDSAEINEEGEFEFHTHIPSIGFYNLVLDRSNFATIVLDSGDHLTFTASADSLGYTYKAEGSKNSERFHRFNDFSMDHQRKMQSISMKKDSLIGYFQNYLATHNNEKTRDSIDKVIQPLFDSLTRKGTTYSEEAKTFAKKFISEDPGSFVNIPMTTYLSFEEDSALFKSVAETLSKKHPGSEMVSKFKKFVSDNLNAYAEQKKMDAKLPVGTTAPEISMPDQTGKTFSLSSLRGKIVLIDFWASWCRPCRQENPNVVRVYKKFKPKGFEILGVSLDREKEAWLQAIEKDGLTWKHVSDLKEFQSPVVNQYGFNGIPFTVLVDREGKVIAKNLRGPALEAKLSEVFENK